MIHLSGRAPSRRRSGRAHRLSGSPPSDGGGWNSARVRSLSKCGFGAPTRRRRRGPCRQPRGRNAGGEGAGCPDADRCRRVALEVQVSCDDEAIGALECAADGPERAACACTRRVTMATSSSGRTEPSSNGRVLRCPRRSEERRDHPQRLPIAFALASDSTTTSTLCPSRRGCVPARPALRHRGRIIGREVFDS